MSRLTDINDLFAPGDGFATEICEDDLGRFAFALEIEGNSMQPDFRPGDRIIIDPDVSPIKNLHLTQATARRHSSSA